MSNFEFVSSKEESKNLTFMSYYLGKLGDVTYNDMVNTFGNPTFNPDDSGDGKVNFEWVFKNSDGEVFTVYDWKEKIDYTMFILGRKGERTFNIGGKSKSGIYDFENYIQRRCGKI